MRIQKRGKIRKKKKGKKQKFEKSGKEKEKLKIWKRSKFGEEKRRRI